MGGLIVEDSETAIGLKINRLIEETEVAKGVPKFKHLRKNVCSDGFSLLLMELTVSHPEQCSF